MVTRNRRETLLRTLEHLHDLEQDFPIVVVDNASTDNTREAICRKFPQVRVVMMDKNIGAVARNYGVRQVSQPYVAFAVAAERGQNRCNGPSRTAKMLDMQPNWLYNLKRIGVILPPDLEECLREIWLGGRAYGQELLRYSRRR
jgi:glycosyltransferase involved in cell wall biosynthesis